MIRIGANLDDFDLTSAKDIGENSSSRPVHCINHYFHFVGSDWVSVDDFF